MTFYMYIVYVFMGKCICEPGLSTLPLVVNDIITS